MTATAAIAVTAEMEQRCVRSRFSCAKSSDEVTATATPLLGAKRQPIEGAGEGGLGALGVQWNIGRSPWGRKSPAPTVHGADADDTPQSNAWAPP